MSTWRRVAIAGQLLGEPSDIITEEALRGVAQLLPHLYRYDEAERALYAVVDVHEHEQEPRRSIGYTVAGAVRITPADAITRIFGCADPGPFPADSWGGRVIALANTGMLTEEDVERLRATRERMLATIEHKLIGEPHAPD